MKRILPFLFFSFSAFQLFAADLYIRDGGTGDGSAWDNALDDFPAMTSITRGDTLWVADGTYGGHEFDKAASGTTVITIKKATEAAHGTETGWSSAYGDGVATFTGSIDFNTPYWVFDGVTGGGPGAWTTGFGFKVTHSGAGWNFYIDGANVQIRHVEVQGNGGDGTQGGTSNDGFAFTDNGDNATISYVYAHDFGRCIIFCNSDADTVVFEYCYFGAGESTAGEHAEVASIWGGAGGWTFRWSIITEIFGTGGLIFDAQTSGNPGMLVYGCVFVHLAGSTWDDANGLIGGWTGGGGEQFHNVSVYNCTFVDTETGGDVLSGFPNTSSGNTAKNNLFYSVGTAVGDVGGVWGTVTHNHFISTTEAGSSTSTSSGDPFTDWVNLDFSLTADTTAGDTGVAEAYRTDWFGNTGTTRGAVQFTTGGGGSTPTTIIATNVAVGTLRLR